MFRFNPHNKTFFFTRTNFYPQIGDVSVRLIPYALSFSFSQQDLISYSIPKLPAESSVPTTYLPCARSDADTWQNFSKLVKGIAVVAILTTAAVFVKASSAF